MATFVLVHGTGCGGWIWQKVAPLLRGTGNDVYTPTLSGLSDRAHIAGCQIDLATHISDVANLISNEDLTDVVLVGNSYGGMVITGVAARIPERLKLLVYLDAYLPDPGQSEADLWPPDMRAAAEAEARTSGGFRQPPPPAVLSIPDPAVEAWVARRLTPQPMATYTQRVPYGDAATAALARAFILCTKGPVTTPVFRTFAAKARANGWPVRELATGHAAMITAPNETAALLLDAAGGRF